MLTMQRKSKGILDAHELSGERPDMAAATCSSSERYTGDTRYLNRSIRLRLWRWHESQTGFSSDYELDRVRGDWTFIYGQDNSCGSCTETLRGQNYQLEPPMKTHAQ